MSSTRRLVAHRRGRHKLPALATRSIGPLRLGSWYHRTGDVAEVIVYPDLPAARRLAIAVRQGRFQEEGRRSRGPLGLGTDLERIREYQPDDDIRQVNWRATARREIPMSNQWRVEQDREVICLIDSGRLMAAPVGDRTRLDAAIDAVAALAAVADEVGDRVGVVAFAGTILRRLSPRRSGGEAVVGAVFDLEPTNQESDYALAFQVVASAKRSLVFIFTDIVEEAAARPLTEAMSVLGRHHAVVVASVIDDDLHGQVNYSGRIGSRRLPDRRGPDGARRSRPGSDSAQPRRSRSRRSALEFVVRSLRRRLPEGSLPGTPLIGPDVEKRLPRWEAFLLNRAIGDLNRPTGFAVDVDLLGAGVTKHRSDLGSCPGVDGNGHQRSTVFETLPVIGGMLVIRCATKNGSGDSTQHSTPGGSGRGGAQCPEQGPSREERPDPRDES